MFEISLPKSVEGKVACSHKQRPDRLANQQKPRVRSKSMRASSPFIMTSESYSKRYSLRFFPTWLRNLTIKISTMIHDRSQLARLQGKGACPIASPDQISIHSPRKTLIRHRKKKPPLSSVLRDSQI
jgi:hypothetical protein